MVRFSVDMMSSTVTVDTSRARKELGWAPVITVDQGLALLQADD
jgi:nucleoside-diphosphate-sugar epimerase